MGEVSVSLSGSFLSSLLFKLKNASGDTEGLLLGKVYSHKVDDITDSQSSGQKEERKICLHSSICFDKKHSFYNYSCKLDYEKLEGVLGARSMDLIGWFSYRRRSSHRLSLKEKAVHKKLVDTVKHLRSKDFLLFLMTDEIVDMSSVCSTDYSFHSWDGRFSVVSSKMLTLPSSMAYQLLPTRLLPQHLLHYNQVLAEQRVHFGTTSGQMDQSRNMENLCAALLHKLQPLKEELISTSEQVREASQEVAELRQRLALAEKEEEEEEEEEEAARRSSDQLMEDVETGVNSGVNSVHTGVLINLGEDNASPPLPPPPTTPDAPLLPLPPTPADSLTTDNSLPPLLPPPPDTLLLPEILTASTELPTNSTDTATNSTPKQEHSHQYLSQELF